MNNFADRFRIAVATLAVLLGIFAIDTIVAEAVTPQSSRLSQDLAPARTSPPAPPPEPTAAAAILRGDLIAAIAAARAAPALEHGKPAPDSPEITAARASALAAARQSLALAPHSSAMWLLVAMLQSRTTSEASDVAVLKMCYLTAAADISVIPARLAILAASAGIADDELRALGRSDIRLILTRRPDLKMAIADAHRGGSAAGKAYIEEVVQSLDPGFAASLR